MFDRCLCYHTIQPYFLNTVPIMQVDKQIIYIYIYIYIYICRWFQVDIVYITQKSIFFIISDYLHYTFNMLQHFILLSLNPNFFDLLIYRDIHKSNMIAIDIFKIHRFIYTTKYVKSLLKHKYRTTQYAIYLK